MSTGAHDTTSYLAARAFSSSSSSSPASLRKSLACVAGLQLTYTTLGAPTRRSVATNDASIPARAGSAMTTSGGGTRSPSAPRNPSPIVVEFLDASVARSHATKVALRTPFSSAARRASSTASGTISHPYTCAHLCATHRPRVPTPQKRSRTISVPSPEKPHASSTAAARRRACAALVWKKLGAERRNVSPRRVIGIVDGP